jgi:hypothetical protein
MIEKLPNKIRLKYYHLHNLKYTSGHINERNRKERKLQNLLSIQGRVERFY